MAWSQCPPFPLQPGGLPAPSETAEQREHVHPWHQAPSLRPSFSAMASYRVEFLHIVLAYLERDSGNSGPIWDFNCHPLLVEMNRFENKDNCINVTRNLCQFSFRRKQTVLSTLKGDFQLPNFGFRVRPERGGSRLPGREHPGLEEGALCRHHACFTCAQSGGARAPDSHSEHPVTLFTGPSTRGD